MSQENVELAYRAQDAFNQRDLDALLVLADPEIEFIPAILELEGGGTYRGHDGLQSWWAEMLTVFPDYRTEADEVRDHGDVTVARARLHAHGTESGALVEETFWAVAEWRDEKCIGGGPSGRRRKPSKPPGCRSRRPLADPGRIGHRPDFGAQIPRHRRQTADI